MADSRQSLFLPTALLLVAALLVGGTSRPLNELLVLLSSLPLLYCLLADRSAPPLEWTAKLALALAGLALVQLVPLPPSVWTALPGREMAVQSLLASGNEIGWRPIALNPGATFVAMLTLIAPISIHIAASRLDPDSLCTLLMVVAGFALFGAAIGIFQRLGGGWQLYATEHAGTGVGLFANRNHHADLLIAGMLLIASLAPAHRRRQLRVLNTVGVLALLFAVIATTSRAGIGLSIPAAIIAVIMIWRPTRRQTVWLGAAGIAGAASLLAIPAFDTIFTRFGLIGEDQRVTMARDTLVAIRAMWPAGSGYGSFVPVYMAYEDLDLLQARYVVAAHNDYLQLALEGGLAGLITAISAPCAVMIMGLALLKRQAPPLMWSCWIISVILLMHSAVDFPLHTATLATLFGFCTGIVQNRYSRLRNSTWTGTYPS